MVRSGEITGLPIRRCEEAPRLRGFWPMISLWWWAWERDAVASACERRHGIARRGAERSGGAVATGREAVKRSGTRGGGRQAAFRPVGWRWGGAASGSEPGLRAGA